MNFSSFKDTFSFFFGIFFFHFLDGIFGEVLFWTLKLTVGKEVYDIITHTAWIKIYSRILSIILPIVVKYELENKDSMMKIGIKRMKSFITSTEENSIITNASVNNTVALRLPFSTVSPPTTTNEVK